MHPLLHLLPAAACAVWFVMFVAEAEQEWRSLPARLNATRRELAKLAGLAALALAATVIAAMPALEWATLWRMPR